MIETFRWVDPTLKWSTSKLQSFNISLNKIKAKTSFEYEKVKDEYHAPFFNDTAASINHQQAIQ